MKEPILESLIDQYLLGTISPADKTLLEKQMASDPSVTVMVEESKLAYKAIVLERNRLLKEKLRQLDKGDMREQHFIPRRWGVATLVVALLILIGTLLTTYFSPVNIARRNFADHTEMMKHSSSLDAAWKTAASAFDKEDYEKAIQAYTALAARADADERFLAKWNILMAQLAVGGPGPGWQLALTSFIDNAPQPLADRARAVSRLLNSTLYRLWFSPLDQKFSTLKPRLI